MIETTDELVAQIRRILPQSQTIKSFKPDNHGQFVSFNWNGRDFVVKRSLETFEVKNNQIFITGASMLMQSALSFKNKNCRILETCIDALRQVEGMLENGRHVEQGLKLLAATKQTLARLSGSAARKQPVAEAMPA